MRRTLLLLPGWVIGRRQHLGEWVTTALRSDGVVFWTRHAWVVAEVLELERDGFWWASWQRWLERMEELDTLEASEWLADG